MSFCSVACCRANVTIPLEIDLKLRCRAFTMNARTRFLITAIFLCHLLFTPSIVTSQLRPSDDRSETEQPPHSSLAKDAEDVSIRAQQQERTGAVYKLRGNAEVHYGAYILKADEVTYNSETGEVTADGHVVLEGGLNDEHVEAGHAAYNLRTQSGKFQYVHGSIGMRKRNGAVVLTTSNPFVFSGKIVEKLGPDHYRVNNGSITTCQLPRPKWQFNAGKVTVDAGGFATIYNSTFRVMGAPVFYFPFMTYPVNLKARKSGFLVPNIGRSNIKGNVIGESAYLALTRSMDVRIGAEYYSKRGWAPEGEFRARPTEKSYVDLNYFAVLDRGTGSGTNRVDQGGGEAHLNAQGTFLDAFRAVADIDYLSSYVFRLAFNEVFTQAVNSEVKSHAFLMAGHDGFFYSAATRRYQNFESTKTGDVITVLHAPGFEVSGVDRKLGKSPFYWSFEAAAEGLSRSEPSFRTANLLGRFDFKPSLSLPLVLRGWSVRPELSLRETFYTQKLVPTSGVGAAMDDPINRKALEGTVEIRPPALERIFDRPLLGNKMKHVIEPRITYRYLTGVNNFPNILRFDERDILSDTHEVEYSLVNRLYEKEVPGKGPDCGPTMSGFVVGRQGLQHANAPWERKDTPDLSCASGPTVREVVTWELTQKYFLDPTFGGALVPGRRNVFTTTADLTGIAFLTDARHLSPLTSRLRVQTTARSEAEWALDYDFRTGRISASTAFLNYHIGPFVVGGGDAFLKVPGEITPANPVPGPERFNQFRLLLGYGHATKKGFSGAANVGFDANLNFLQYTAVQSTYNWDCCGVSLEYRHFNLGAASNVGSVRNENQFRFTFSLANIGAFGNLRRQERLF